MQTPTINNKAYTFVGTTDEVTQCGCCGRSGLKGTVVLVGVDAGDFVYFGSSCAATALGWGAKEVNTSAKQADKDRKTAIRQAVASHPYQAVINAEIEDANAKGLRFAQRRELMLRWAELRSKIRADVAELFSVPATAIMM